MRSPKSSPSNSLLELSAWFCASFIITFYTLRGLELLFSNSSVATGSIVDLRYQQETQIAHESKAERVEVSSLFSNSVKYGDNGTDGVIDVDAVDLSEVETTLGDSIKQAGQARRIPKNIFFIVFTSGTKNTVNFLTASAIYGAEKFLKPENIIIICDVPLEGVHWDNIKKKVTRARQVLVPLPTHVRGIRLRDSSHVLHASDALRLRLLIEFGGIFLDNDIIPIKPMDDLLESECVLGVIQEEVAAGNAVILAKPNSKFINLWWEAYKSYVMVGSYVHLSVNLPAKLTRYFPHHARMVNNFYQPLFSEKQKLFQNQGYDWQDNYVLHVWFGPRPSNIPEADVLDSLLGQVIRRVYHGTPDLIGTPMKNKIICRNDGDRCRETTPEERKLMDRGKTTEDDLFGGPSKKH